jgi:hypothetical protein
VVTEGLVRLGILKGSVEENLQSGAFQAFYMHGLSHWLGLDVHDAGSYQEPDGSPRAFRPGMVLSNEPGIYIRDGWPGVDPKWYDIGVRLENDVLVTEGEAVDLTARIPRAIADVEAEMAKPPLVLETGEVGPPLPLPPGPGAAAAAAPEARADTVEPPGAGITREAGKTKRPGGS